MAQATDVDRWLAGIVGSKPRRTTTARCLATPSPLFACLSGPAIGWRALAVTHMVDDGELARRRRGAPT